MKRLESMKGSRFKEISLGDSFGAVAVTVNGKRIEISAEGAIEIKPASGNTLTGSAAPCFWSVSRYGPGDGIVWRGGEENWSVANKFLRRGIPVIRSGPART